MTISVVIPSYNRADLVLLTLDSVLAQTRPADEVIVVDDGSTDGTREAVAAYNARRGGRVRYHRRENGGLSAARNTGLALSSGEAVCMLDSDDLLRPGALAALEAALAADPDAALAYCRSQTIDEGGRVTQDLWPQPDGEGYVWSQLVSSNFIRSPGAALVRRSHLVRIGEADMPYEVADWGMWMLLAERSPFVRVVEPFFQYRVHSNSMSANSAAMAWALYQLYRFLLRHYENDCHRRRETAIAFNAFRQKDGIYLAFLACRNFFDGDFESARWRLRVAYKIWPRIVMHRPLIQYCFERCERKFAGWFGDTKIALLLKHVYWSLNHRVFRHAARAYWGLNHHLFRRVARALSHLGGRPSPPTGRP